MSDEAPEHNSNNEDKNDTAMGPCLKNELTEDELCGCRTNCCGKTSPCQPLATVGWTMFLLCFGNMALQTVSNGLLSVNISTIEKRFELRSTESGMMISAGDIAQVIAMLFILTLSENVRKPRWIGIGLLISGIGTIMLSVPHFIIPTYTFIDSDIFNYCQNVTEPICSHSSILRNYRYWFMVGIALVGFGMGPLYSYSIAYIDESTDKRNSAMYNAIYMAMGGLGPAIGYVAGGLALEMYTDIGKRPEEIGIDSSSYVWVGAWWIGFLLFGILIIVNSIPVFMLPKHLPGTTKHRKNRNTEAQRSHLQNINDSPKSGLVRAFSEVLLLLKNKPYVFNTLGIAMNCALIYGFNTFGAKYLESVFGMSPFQASLLYGIAAIFASFGAQLTGGFIIKKLNLGVTGIIKFVIITALLSALCSIGFIVHCPDIDFMGGTVPYPNTTFTISPTSSCNMDCECSTDRYEPICNNEDESMYFSPCYAGCNVQINETAFTNCSCVANSSFFNPVLSTESCNRKPCAMMYPFIIIVFICFFTSILTLSPSVQITLRCVPFAKRVFALSLQSVITRLIGVIPGRILVGVVLDLACVAWGTECGDQGSCKAYKRDIISRNNTLLLISQTTMCAFFFSMVLLTYKPAVDSQDDKQQNDVLIKDIENRKNLSSHSTETNDTLSV